MKNRFHLLATAVVSLLCVSCAETQVSQSGSEKAVNPPIMGWSSWNAFRVDISEDIIKNQADLMVKKGLKDAGYHYINIDDGFFGERDGNGKMQTNKNRFPNGMKPVADHIHSLGMKAGIYTDAGNNTCGSIWDNDHAGVGAGIYGHEQQDAQLYFGDWGFDFIKIDYCGGDVLGLNEQERYTSIRNSIDKVNKDVSVNICRWAFPGTWAKDVATSWRISGDINAHWGSLRYVVGKNPKGIIYAADQEASGKMKVGFLGGQPENYAEWPEVYSADGGRYQMTVHYSFGKGRQLEIDVNGIVTKIDSLGEDDKHNQVTIPVDLKAGYNHIRMGNSYNWAPDIDCFTLTKGM